MRSIFILFLLALFMSCKDRAFNNASILNPKNTNQETDPIVEDTPPSVGRAIWQKPELVIEKLGDISDKVIADIGAGTGYFSFKLVGKSKKVIAIEIDKKFIDFIDSTKMNLPADKRSKIEARLALPNDPLLKTEEVDIILIINTIAYIKDLPSYLSTLMKGLKKNGKLMIIDYKMKRLPINAPPKTERVYIDKVEDILIEAGFKDIQSDDTSLDYQYIIQAIKN